ncbi:TPA: hypothetical protein O7S29_005063 [Salmonella enterica]|nr:hypothetical protein [Salmonella enterica]
MNNDQWLSNRLRGDFAESIAMIHFSALGYRVERTGIEYTAPFYANLRSKGKQHGFMINSQFAATYNFMSKYPDFIASRESIHPKTGEPTIHSFLIEVKYRRHVDLSLLKTELKNTYKEHISLKLAIFVYLVCKTITNESDVTFKSSIRPDSFRIFFCYLGHDRCDWWEAGTENFDNNYLYKLDFNKEKDSFNRIYRDVIIEYLNEFSM